MKQETEECRESDEENLGDSTDLLYCDVCEADFGCTDEYEYHLSTHRKCEIDGCDYVASETMLEEHVKTQHLTGLYEKIYQTQTPEDIAKWVDERRAKYPSKENIKRRYERQEAMFKRGEKIQERNNRFGKDKTRLSQVKQRCAKKVPQQKKDQGHKTLIDEKSEWNGTMFPFRGTSTLYGDADKDEDGNEYDDNEWGTGDVNKPVETKLQNALGSLMAAYGSDESDDEAPQEETIKKAPPDELPMEREETESKPKNKRKSKFAKCKSKKVKTEVAVPVKPKFVRRRITLLEKLLDSEIRHERNVLLQCVKFVVDNNFLNNK